MCFIIVSYVCDMCITWVSHVYHVYNECTCHWLFVTWVTPNYHSSDTQLSHHIIINWKLAARPPAPELFSNTKRDREKEGKRERGKEVHTNSQNRGFEMSCENCTYSSWKCHNVSYCLQICCVNCKHERVIRVHVQLVRERERERERKRERNRERER
jgi:hypothetical protein